MTDQSVKLERYEAKFDEFVRQFELPEEQAVFTGIPAQIPHGLTTIAINENRVANCIRFWGN
ncbi:hypothetical protein PAE9249_05376 [Paenibacillus sp. CECT 9249]|uniref:hypothetical protein n=1 Tax=Paenibacillus sp. CECT 9249 TaxID=2845385 RepID=UPI001E5D0A4A|nr:hypothetical protein [Paenibacillus sp. CECT 9249]CAH0122783.1 hypothetical protein PAE9249_05376 [Paenibacillus sp. CECT 9249]